LWTHAKHLLLAANAMITALRVVIIIAAPLLRWPDVDRQGALLLLDPDLQQCGSLPWAASTSLRGDCCRSRRKYRR
jgi:hypothetical protein